jgi:hypothetical protein
MREELERIWQKPGVAFPCHIAGWSSKQVMLRKRINTKLSDVYMAVRNRIVPLKIIRKKRK